MGTDALTLVFWMLSFKPTFSLSCITFIMRLLSSSSLLSIRVVSSAYLRLLLFLLAILIPAYASSSPANYAKAKENQDLGTGCVPLDTHGPLPTLTQLCERPAWAAHIPPCWFPAWHYPSHRIPLFPLRHSSVAPSSQINCSDFILIPLGSLSSIVYSVCVAITCASPNNTHNGYFK